MGASNSGALERESLEHGNLETESGGMMAFLQATLAGMPKPLIRDDGKKVPHPRLRFFIMPAVLKGEPKPRAVCANY